MRFGSDAFVERNAFEVVREGGTILPLHDQDRHVEFQLLEKGINVEISWVPGMVEQGLERINAITEEYFFVEEGPIDWLILTLHQ